MAPAHPRKKVTPGAAASWLAAVAAFALTWVAWGRAHGAEPVGSVAVVPALGAELPEGAAKEFEKSLRASLERIPGIEFVKAELVSTEHSTGDEAPELRRRLDAARDLYDRMELGPAISELRSIRADAEPLFGKLGDAELVPDILLLLALAELADGRPEAHETFMDWARIRPDGKLSSDDYPPKVLKALTDAKKALGPLSVVEVESTPSGAEVTVDSLPRGRTPVSVELPVGRHVVTLNLARYAPMTAPVDISEGDIASVDVTLTADGVGKGLADVAKRIDKGETARDLSPILGRLAAELGVDAVVQPLMERIEGGFLLSALVVRPGSRRFYVWAATTVDGTMHELAVSTALLATIITSGEDSGNLRARSAGGTAPPFPELNPNGALTSLGSSAGTAVPKKRSGGGKLATRWWLWTGVAVVVAGGVVGGLAAGGVFRSELRVRANFPTWEP